MNSSAYYIASIGFIILSMICFLLILAGLRKALRKTDYTETRRRKIVTGTALALFGWMIYASALASAGILYDFSSMPPRLILIILPPLIVAIFLMVSGRLDKILKAVPQTWLVTVQAFRIPVEIFLWLLFTENLIPIQMTFEGRNMDIISGILAPLAAFLFYHYKSKIILVIYNLIGLILLINIVTVAILSVPGPLRYFMNEPGNTIVATFPTVVLPAILVPMAYYMHLFSLRKIVLDRK